MNKVNVYKVKFTKTFDIEIQASSPDEAIEQARQLCNDDGMMWEKPIEEIECEEIEGYYCPACGSSLTAINTNIKNHIIEHLMSCINEDCALDWTITTDTANGNFLGIQRYFHG